MSFFLLGAGPILWVISTTTLRQSVTPPSLLGRVSAINIMSYGARPLGSALGAIVGGLYSAEACLYLAAAIFARAGAGDLDVARGRRWRGSRTWWASRRGVEPHRSDAAEAVIASAAKQSILARAARWIASLARNDVAEPCFALPKCHMTAHWRFPIPLYMILII